MRTRRERGFTLLETLIALAITAVVLGAAWRAVVRSAEARDQATSRAHAADAVRDAVLALAGEVAAAEPDALVVAAAPAAPRLRWRAATRVVALALDGDRLVRRDASAFAPPDAAAPPAVTVLRGVRGLTVRALAGRSWTDAWQGDGLPRALELGVETADGVRWRTRVVLALAGAPR
jgi:prepilin-type N-terminal cleavage/methylation domain-containing protein